MKKTGEFRNLNGEEIQNRIGELKKELIKDNVQVASGTNPANAGRMRQAKKNIARLLTVLKQKEAEAK